MHGHAEPHGRGDRKVGVPAVAGKGHSVTRAEFGVLPADLDCQHALDAWTSSR